MEKNGFFYSRETKGRKTAERGEKMKERYQILYKGGEGEIVEKKSRFIACIEPVPSEEEALAFIGAVRRRFWDARHHCYAYTVGENHETARCSDDGEPSQTAGRPMLDVLLGRDIHNACAVVTRYFGGTLLGTGGLVRAYSGAVQEGLSSCVVLEKCLAYRWILRTDYSGLGKVQYLLAEAGLPVLESDYGAQVSLTVLVSADQTGAARKKITEGTNGRCAIEEGDALYFGMDGQTPVLL